MLGAASLRHWALPGRVQVSFLAMFRKQRVRLAWLRTHVHSKGSSLGTNELLTEATGAPLGAAAFRKHIDARYLT